MGSLFKPQSCLYDAAYERGRTDDIVAQSLADIQEICAKDYQPDAATASVLKRWNEDGDALVKKGQRAACAMGFQGDDPITQAIMAVGLER